jgi:hypothetical protein
MRIDELALRGMRDQLFEEPRTLRFGDATDAPDV